MLIDLLIKPKKNSSSKNFNNNNSNNISIPMQNTVAISPDVSIKMEDNKIFLQEKFENSSDVTFSEFESVLGMKGMLVYISGLVKQELLNRDVVNQFISKAKKEIGIKELRSLLSVSKIKETQTMATIIESILDGNTIMFADNLNTALIIEAIGFEERGVETPDTENVLRGPKEGFNENIKVNMALLRRKIKNEKLVFDTLKLGKQTRTLVAIAYIKGIANQEVLDEVKNRINSINTDSILETGYIEQLIEDAPSSIHSTIGNTQKPDVVAAKLLEGRVAIFCDGTPFVLTVPHLLVENLQTSEDYYVRPFIASLLRFVRVTSLLISILLPALYVALQTFHSEMIPTILLLRLIVTKETIPFPTLIEALIMVFAFELLRESGTRLPKTVGSAVSIVGGLILGDAAVNAGIVGPIMVVIIGTCAVSTFINPGMNEVSTVYRIIMLILGGIMGLYGISCGIFMVLIHLTSLRSFGVPYTSPLTPFEKNGMMDFIIRFPLSNMNKRPQSIVKSNETRRGKS